LFRDHALWQGPIKDDMIVETVERDGSFVVHAWRSLVDLIRPRTGFIDFDHIYDVLIRKTIEDIDIECIRCDEIPKAGWIQWQMFRQIYEANVAIVDITALNPNVFYELGIRHALCGRATILIRRVGTQIPFNINGLKVIEYPADMTKIDQAQRRIAALVQNGLNSREPDSPVYNVLKLRVGEEAPALTTQQTYCYGVTKAGDKQIRLITGDLQHVKNIDIWVSSENTNMQMSRHYEKSISAVIRFLGAERDEKNHVTKDTIADELTCKMGKHASVDPGTVIATGPGALARPPYCVKRIFHAAAVVGQVGKGYTPIPDLKNVHPRGARAGERGSLQG
jgi:hypothetical protein